MKKEFGKCVYVLETVNTHYINCSMPDIQVRTFVTNFESIFISHLHNLPGPSELGSLVGDNFPHIFWQKYNQTLLLQRP